MRAPGSGCLALGFLSALSPAFALQTTPVLRLDVLGGQMFFRDYAGVSDTLSGSAAGSADWLLAAGLRATDRDELIPSLSGQYLRRDQVDQIGGGGTLVSQTLDDTASLRWVHAMGDWALKPNVSYKSEQVASLPQDRLGAGFFDLSQPGAGLELERKGERLKSLRQSLSVSEADYYNYDPVASPLFGVELLLGPKALNFETLAYSISADWIGWRGGLLSGQLSGSLSDYPDQPVLGAVAGNPSAFVVSSRDRQDWQASGVVSAAQSFKTSLFGRAVQGSAGLSAGAVVLASNQNDFDAFQSNPSLAQFNPNFYSYAEGSIGPLASVSCGRWRASLSYTYTRRQYADRPVQDASGNYLGGTVRTETHSAAGALSLQLGGGLSAQVSGGYTSASSNAKFENYYLYNYSFPFYFVGLGYAL